MEPSWRPTVITAKPICTIPWSYEDKREVLVYTDAHLTMRQQQDLCIDIATRLVDADSRMALAEVFAQIGRAAGYDVAIHGFGPRTDHSDPLGNVVSVALTRRR